MIRKGEIVLCQTQHLIVFIQSIDRIWQLARLPQGVERLADCK